MRDWNLSRFQTFEELEKEFIDYLWGIETGDCYGGMQGKYKFIDYLWGIETLLRREKQNGMEFSL